jgi:uncharacterized protein YbjT (DUF2867 family)
MTYLITGATGPIGRSLVDQLLHDGTRPPPPSPGRSRWSAATSLAGTCPQPRWTG